MNLYSYNDNTLTGFQMLWPDGQIKPTFLLSEVRTFLGANVRTAHLRQFEQEEGIEFMVVNSSELVTVLPQDSVRPGLRTVLSDSGLLELLIMVHSPLGAQLRHWLSRTVVPAIFRDGYYIASDRDEEFIALKRQVEMLTRMLGFGFGDMTLGDLAGWDDQ